MLNWAEIVIRIALAALFGALVGLERERKHWAAGLRTHMMVCVGSCLVMIVSAFGFLDILGTEHVALDPSRIAAQVISGIGFIGAGTILLLKQGTIRGLTTASGLWTVAAIGLATGGGMYFAAVVTTIVALVILWALQPLERYYSGKFKHKTLRITTTPTINNNELLKDIFNKPNYKIQSFNLEKQDDKFIIRMEFDNADTAIMNEVTDQLKINPDIKEIFWN